jgi:Glycosyl hydrolase family 26
MTIQQILLDSESAAVTPPSGITLLAYLKTLGANAAGVLSGQTLDPYSSTPLDALDTTDGASFPSITVYKPGPQTGLCPAVIDLMLNQNQPNGTVTRNNPAPNNTLSLANAAIAAGCIVRLNGNPANPAGAGNNPWPDVLTAGSTIQNAYLATLAADAALMKQITGPFIYDFMGEMNLTSSTALQSGNNWACISTCTSAQFAALWVLTWNYLTTTEGLSGKMLWSYETNDGVGNYTWGFPGNEYVDLVGVHTWAPFTATAAALQGLETVTDGQPVGLGSMGLTYQSVTPFSANNFTQCCSVITADYPQIAYVVFWGTGGDQLSNQNGAVECMSMAPWLNRANVPVFSGNK